jgi:hypothetical protein
VSSDPKPEDIKKTARNKAQMWYRRIENRVAPVVAFGSLIAENTTRWAFEKRNQHYYTTYYQAKEFLRAPCRNIVGFLRAREIEALSSLWDLSWNSPAYSNPRKVYKVIPPDADPTQVAVSATRKDEPLPMPFKNPPSKE